MKKKEKCQLVKLEISRILKINRWADPLVTSAPENREARFKIRKTWAEQKSLEKHKIEVNFVIGVTKEDQIDIRLFHVVIWK